MHVQPDLLLPVALVTVVTPASGQRGAPAAGSANIKGTRRAVTTPWSATMIYLRDPKPRDNWPEIVCAESTMVSITTRMRTCRLRRSRILSLQRAQAVVSLTVSGLNSAVALPTLTKEAE